MKYVVGLLLLCGCGVYTCPAYKTKPTELPVGYNPPKPLGVKEALTGKKSASKTVIGYSWFRRWRQ